MKTKLKIKTIELANLSFSVLTTKTGGGNEGCCSQACTHWCWSEQCGFNTCYHAKKF